MMRAKFGHLFINFIEIKLKICLKQVKKNAVRYFI